MKKSILTISFILLNLLIIASCKKKDKTPQKATPKLELIAEVNNLSHCESVAFDPKRNVLYVSVQANQVENDGSIAKLSLDGKLLKADFITGLNNPKGIAVVNDKLYVSDITELVEVDLTTEKITKKYKGENAEFLNDVAIAKNGEVYVSDMFTSSIYKLDNQGNFKNWMSSPTLENPNGLLVIDNEMFIASWGTFSDKKPLNAPQGRFLKLNIPSKKIDIITSNAIGNLDGLQVYNNDNFLLSDWKKGTVLKVSKKGQSELFFQTKHSVGDILYLPKERILALPINKENKVLIYSVKK